MSGMTLQYKKKIRNIRVRLPNNTSIKVKIDGSSKIIDLMRPICLKLNLPNPFDYSLQKYVDENLMEWLNPLLSLDEQDVDKRDILFIKKRFFSLSDRKIEKSNELKLQLLYDLCVYSVINSEFPCNQSEAIELAALNLQILYGDYITFPNGLKKDAVLKLLPKRCAKHKNADKNIINAYKELHGLKPFEAKRRYIQICKRNEYYGYTFFKASTKNSKKVRDVLIGLNSGQFIILDFISLEIIRSHPIQDLKQYYANIDKLTLSFKDHEDICLNSKVSPIIAYMIGVYIDMTLKNKKAITPVGKVDEILFNKMLNSVVPELYEDSNEEFRYNVPALNEKELYDQSIAFINIIMSHMKVLGEECSTLENEVLGDPVHRLQMISYKYELDKCINRIDGIIRNDDCNNLDKTVLPMIEILASFNSSISDAVYKKDPRVKLFLESVTPVNKVIIRLLRYMALLSTKSQKNLSNKALNIIKKYKSLSNNFKLTQSSHIVSLNLENLLVYVVHLMNVSIINLEKELTNNFNSNLDSNKIMEEIKAIMESIINRMVNNGHFMVTDRLIEELNDYNQEAKRKMLIISEHLEEHSMGNQEYQNFSLYSSEFDFLLSIIRIQNTTGTSEDILEAGITLEMMLLKFINSPKDRAILKSLINAVNIFISLTDNIILHTRTTKKIFRHSKDSIIAIVTKLNQEDEKYDYDITSRCCHNMLYHLRQLVSCLGIVPSVRTFREYTLLAILNVHKLLILMKERINNIRDLELRERIIAEENDIGINILKILKAIDQKEEAIDIDYVLTIQDFKDFQSMLNRFSSFVLSSRPYFENYDLMLLNDITNNLNYSVRLMDKSSQILQNIISLNETSKAIEITSMTRKKLESLVDSKLEKKNVDFDIDEQFQTMLSNTIAKSLRMINCIKDFEKYQIIPIFLISDSINKMEDEILLYASKHKTKGKAALSFSIIALENYQKALESTINFHSLLSYSECIRNTVQKLISFVQSLHSLGNLINPEKHSGRLLTDYYTSFLNVCLYLIQCRDHIVTELPDIAQDLEQLYESLENLNLACQNNEEYMISRTSSSLIHSFVEFLYKLTQVPPEHEIKESANTLCEVLFSILENISYDPVKPIQDEINSFNIKLHMIRSQLSSSNKHKENLIKILQSITNIIQSLKHPDYSHTYNMTSMNTTSFYCSKILSTLKLISTSFLTNNSCNEFISALKSISIISLHRITSSASFRQINDLKTIFSTLASIYGNHKNELRFKLQIIKENSNNLISRLRHSIGSNNSIFQIKINEYEEIISNLEEVINKIINYIKTHERLLFSQHMLEKEIREQRRCEKELLSLYKNLHNYSHRAENIIYDLIILSSPEYIQCNKFHEKLLFICNLSLNLLNSLGMSKSEVIQTSIKQIQQEINELLFIEESIVLKNPSYNILNINPIVSCISNIDCAMQIGKVVIGNYFYQLRDIIDKWIEELNNIDVDLIKQSIYIIAPEFTTVLINFALSQLNERDVIFNHGKEILELSLRLLNNLEDHHSCRHNIIESLKSLKDYIDYSRLSIKEWVIEKLKDLKFNCQRYPSAYSFEKAKDDSTFESISSYGEKLISVSTKLIEDLSKDIESKHLAELAIHYERLIFDYIKSITSESRWEEVIGHYIEAIDYFILSFEDKEHLNAMCNSTKLLMTVCKELVDMNKEIEISQEQTTDEEKTDEISPPPTNSIQQIPDIIEPNHLISDTIMEYAKDIALAVTNLVNASLDLQKEIGIEDPKSSGKYHEDPTWEKGFLSTGLGVAASISLLIKYANAAYRGENDVHHLVAAAKSVYTATSHLVVISRVKAPYESPSMEKLDQISKYISEVTGKLVDHVKTLNNVSNESTTHSASVDKAKLSQRVHNLEKQVRIHKLEKKLEEARNNLLKWRKNRYKSLIVETD